MSKPRFVISSPFDTYSGYGARSRDIIKSIIQSNKYQVELLSQRWGDTSWGFCKDHPEWEFLLDYKIPLLLHFKDKNKKNYRKENIEFLCYNCFYLTIGDVFDNKQIEGIEDHKPVNLSEVDWEVDDYTAQRLKELGLGDDEDDGLDIVSYV
mgnify:CR=1 FL=1